MNSKLAKQYFEKAEALYRSGEAEEALMILDTLDEAFPESNNVMFARARTLAALDRSAEALTLCNDLVVRFGSERAQTLRDSILAEPARPTETAPKLLRTRRFALLALVITLGLGSIGVTWRYARDISHAPESLAAPTQSEYDQRLREREVERRAAAAPPGEPSTLPTYKGGLPQWVPGTFVDVPCLREPAHALDVLIPPAYETDPTALFPVVVMQMPRPTTGFYGLTDWGNSRQVILVLLKNSRNRAEDRNRAAQDSALKTISETMRADPRLGFALGMSGGGISSWMMICRYPENFQGLVLMGMAGLHACRFPTHVRLGYIHGENDHNNWGRTSGVYYEIPVLRERGHAIRQITVPGGHVTGPLKAREAMLDWMLKDTLKRFGLPHEHVPEATYTPEP